jgi:hypothetical protein
VTSIKLCAFIVFYFFTRASLAANCETFSEASGGFNLCWDDKLKAWISEPCLSVNCEARNLLSSSSSPRPERRPQTSSQNPSSVACDLIETEVIILRDSRQNESTFCKFKDKSLIEASAVERKIFSNDSTKP